MHLTPTPPARARRPWLTLLALAGGVAMLHLVLWQGMADSFAAESPTNHRAVVQVRTLTPAPPPPVQAPTPVAVVARPAPPPARRLVKPSAEPMPPLTPAPMPTAVAPAPMLVAAALPAQPTPEPAPAVAVAAEPDDLPVYRTRIPPAMTLNYEMHRGAWSGTGELQWRPTASGYQARLEGRIAGFSILTWVSQGGFDAAGLAPVRYTDRRRGKGEQAANFQREAGKISFSGPSTEYPLLQGAQDRMRWIIHIAAIASADPKRLASGSRLTMYVVGARGDAEAWAFLVQGSEEVVTGNSTVRATKLLREPRKPHDTRVEVWLAPSLHYLPVRARLTNEGAPALELVLQTAQPLS